MASRKHRWDDEMEHEFPSRDGKRRKRSHRRKKTVHIADPFGRPERRTMRRQTTSEYERDDALPESLDAAFSDEDIEENEVVPLDFDADSDYEYADRLDAETLEDLGIDYSPRDWE